MQPRDGRFGDLLTRALRSGTWTDLWFAVAFVRMSGLRHLDEPLRAFASAGGRTRAAVGYDLYGTSFDAISQLMGAVRWRGDVVLVHDPDTPPTFHPKCFVLLKRASARGRIEEALVFTGSTNISEAALYVNDEAFTIWSPTFRTTAHSWTTSFAPLTPGFGPQAICVGRQQPRSCERSTGRVAKPKRS